MVIFEVIWNQCRSEEKKNLWRETERNSNFSWVPRKEEVKVFRESVSSGAAYISAESCRRHCCCCRHCRGPPLPQGKSIFSCNSFLQTGSASTLISALVLNFERCPSKDQVHKWHVSLFREGKATEKYSETCLCCLFHWYMCMLRWLPIGGSFPMTTRSYLAPGISFVLSQRVSALG